MFIFNHPLQGGFAAVDMAALETLLVRFSTLLCDLREVQEIDINPLLASSAPFIALDARVLLAPPNLPASQQPRLAIVPYPIQYTTAFALNDGMQVDDPRHPSQG